MKFIQYQYEGVQRFGVLKDGLVFSVSDLLEKAIPDLQTFLGQDQPTALALLAYQLSDETNAETKVAEVHLLAPIQRPRHDILAVGVNYFDHVTEVAHALDESFQERRPPVFFSKRALTLTGPEETLQGAFELDDELDYEAEMAVIIGKPGKDIPANEALDHVFGYSCFNDFSSRKLQRAHQQWFKGKSLDGYSALGPVIVTAEEFSLADPHQIQSFVNGEKRQDALLSQMMTSVPELIAELSAGMTLVPGDIIVTGTPAGVAMGMVEPKFLQPGDTVTVHIDGIGDLTNHIQ